MKEYRNPKPTVDIIIELKRHNSFNIVLIKRKNPPFGYALPGGFVDEGESLLNAAIREAKEETGLDVNIYRQFFTYSSPGRDPRMHSISTVYLARAEGEPVAGDDAAEILLVSPEHIPQMAFDHAEIINDYLEFLKTGKLPSLAS
ncbi:MAG: NUDIX hydrolase [Deltaproteobacteria bacterium]|nr:NUDIX hydrolase [Deltaproteobacteria bacterium]